MAGKQKTNYFIRLIKLWVLYARMDAAWFLRDMKICLLAICSDWVAGMASALSIFMLAWRFDGVAGMGRYEVLLMLGYGMMISGTTQLFGNFNTSYISRRIGRGQVDHMLIQPLPLPVQLITEGFVPFSGSSIFLSGVAVIFIAVHLLGIAITPAFVAMLALQALCTFAILIALSFIVGSTAFYVPIAGEEMSSVVFEISGDLGSYPLSILPNALQWVLVTLLPVGMHAWFPASVLAGKPPLQLPAFWPAVLALILAFTATKIFQKGLKHYVQYGCNRYRDMGHRR